MYEAIRALQAVKIAVIAVMAARSEPLSGFAGAKNKSFCQTYGTNGTERIKPIEINHLSSAIQQNRDGTGKFTNPI